MIGSTDPATTERDDAPGTEPGAPPLGSDPSEDEATPRPAAPEPGAPSGALSARGRRARRLSWDDVRGPVTSAAAIVAAVLLWQALSQAGVQFVLSFDNVPTPVAVAQMWKDLLLEAEFYTHIRVSMTRIGIGFTIASVLGIAAGILIGRFRTARDILTPYIEILRPIPAVAWIPLSILILPTEESSIIFITSLGAFFPVTINTVHGVVQTPELLLRAASALGANDASILRHVVLPSALPSIVAGLAIGMGVSWFSLLAGEIISGQYGIGYFTWSAYTLVQYPQIIVGMLTIGGLGTLSTWLVRRATAPLLRWQEA